MRKLPSRRSFHTLEGHEHILWRKGASEPIIARNCHYFT